ncbi:tetratricopeptide repeat protein [Geomonas nitrogeniifigens]|uniref:O-linked N-acetylglucosamine transferase, SPINDLY family protein n=1 Tax=Geomonas diazotrophica TaxID=2843197 RepID=UPI001C2BBB63|nr:tetratricopeptide repeat protein [Geomonas nitrogeniifigens]QXE86206.1 tetratricopeptide repeat protein [Geomonas nitrogeniifigens]
MNPEQAAQSQAQLKYVELLLRKGMQEEARARLEELVRQEPPCTGAFYLLAVLKGEDGLPQEAAELLARTLALEPENTRVLNALGGALRQQGELEQAAAAFAEALRIDPRFSEARINLALLLKEALRFGEAELILRAGIDLAPGSVRLNYNLANVLHAQGRSLEAVAAYRETLRLDPDHLDARQNLLFALHYSPQSSRREIYAEHLKAARSRPFRPPRQEPPARPTPGGRIRVGYLSPDFRGHAVASFIEPVLREHDRDRFEIFCYANVPTPDPTTRRLMGLTEQWRDIHGMADHNAAALIARDGIDILFDLAGHTSGSRLPVFCHRPAPIQVTWIGYPDTTGLRALDYRITDALADPPGAADRWHSERLLRLPRSFCCYLPPVEAPELVPPPCGANGGITFGSFNNLSKVTPEMIAIWSRLLREVDGSRLLLKAKPLADDGVRRRILAGFAEHGVAARQLELDPGQPGTREHLEQYQRVDIALDTFPYNGTTTTCEALWMGVPVISLSGERHCSRTGASLLTNCGLADLVTTSEAAYLDMARQVAGDRATLREFRGGARERLLRSPLLDAVGVTRELEAVLAELRATSRRRG